MALVESRCTKQMAFDDGPIPPYFQLKTLLLDAVLSGEYRPGDRLPTEHELCRRYGISRTPVSRALSELAEEGVLVRQRRNGTFVNPHWLRRPSDRAEVRIVVPEGPWESMIRAAATSTAVGVSVVTVPRPTLHQFLTHAVAEGQAPDLALLDSVWLPEFAEAGFVHALEDVDERWIRDEYETDFLAPLVSANRYGGRTGARRSRVSVGASLRGRGPGCGRPREALPRAASAIPSRCPGARRAERRRPTASSHCSRRTARASSGPGASRSPPAPRSRRSGSSGA
jgi:DNA-binding transcriptional regulator YhcF (GntR family)